MIPRTAAVLLCVAICICVTRVQATPLGNVRHHSAGAVVVTELRSENGRLSGRNAESTVDAWVLAVDARGARFVAPTAATNGHCDATLKATVELRDRNADGLIDPRRDEYARIYATVTWRTPSGAGAAVLALDVGPGTARLLWLRTTDTWAALGLPAAPPTVVHPAAGRTLLVLGAGWPREDDPARARGELLMLDADSGVALPSPFATDAALVSGATALDLDADGVTDRLYLADARLRVWRLERHAARSEPNTALRLTSHLLADLSSVAGASSASAIQFAPDVALAGGTRQWLNVTVGTSDRPGHSTTRHFLVTLQDALTGNRTSAPLVIQNDEVFALPGPLAATPLTLAGRLLIATAKRSACGLPLPVVITIRTSVVPSIDGAERGPVDYQQQSTTISASSDSELVVTWKPDEHVGATPARCFFGDVELPVCPAGPGLTRDYWLRRDAP